MGTVPVAAAAPPSLLQRKRLRRGLRELRVALPFMLPGFVFVLLFVLWPLARGVQMSLFDWNLMVPAKSTFVGAANFVRALTEDPVFWVATRNTVIYAVVTVPGQLALGLGAALLLNAAIRGRVIFRTLYYLPVITSWLVVSYVFAYLFTDGLGPVNHLLVKVLHIVPEPIDWLHNTWTAQVPINLLGIWKGVGWTMVILLAGLQTIPKELYEVAAVDGASGWRRFRSLTLPLLKPTLVFVAIVLTIGAFNVFLSVYLLTGGAPERSTEVLLSYMYTQSFRFLDFGYGVSIGLLMGVAVIVLSFTQRRLLRGAVEY